MKKLKLFASVLLCLLLTLSTSASYRYVDRWILLDEASVVLRLRVLSIEQCDFTCNDDSIAWKTGEKARNKQAIAYRCAVSEVYKGKFEPETALFWRFNGMGLTGGQEIFEGADENGMVGCSVSNTFYLGVGEEYIVTLSPNSRKRVEQDKTLPTNEGYALGYVFWINGNDPCPCLNDGAWNVTVELNTLQQDIKNAPAKAKAAGR